MRGFTQTHTRHLDRTFFNPPELMTLFALTQLDGAQRCDALKIKHIHYANAKVARKWLDTIYHDLAHLEIHRHPLMLKWRSSAYNTLFNLWSRMTDLPLEDYPYKETVSHRKLPVQDTEVDGYHFEKDCNIDPNEVPEIIEDVEAFTLDEFSILLDKYLKILKEKDYRK